MPPSRLIPLMKYGKEARQVFENLAGILARQLPVGAPLEDLARIFDEMIRQTATMPDWTFIREVVVGRVSFKGHDELPLIRFHTSRAAIQSSSGIVPH